MTPKRKKWWDSLPANEKELRESLKTHRRLLSLNKMPLTDNKDNAYIAKMIRRQKLFIKAIKHELDRKTKMVYTGSYEGISPIYRCEKCGSAIKDIGWYCPWCGRKTRERKE